MWCGGVPFSTIPPCRVLIGALCPVSSHARATSSGAVCLDGSSPVYYFRPGSGNGSTKFILFLEGGGWCAGLSTAVGGFDSCTAMSTLLWANSDAFFTHFSAEGHPTRAVCCAVLSEPIARAYCDADWCLPSDAMINSCIQAFRGPRVGSAAPTATAQPWVLVRPATCSRRTRR